MIYFPDIFEYSDYEPFFKHFVEENKRRDAKISYRFIAHKLSWPASYLNDLLYKRKKLSNLRALEFARFAKFDAFQTERLIYMCLKENASHKVHDYFEGKMKSEFDKEPRNLGPLQWKDFGYIEALAIACVLGWRKGPLSARQIQKLLFTFPDLDEEKIKAALQYLVDKGVFKKVGEDLYQSLEKELYLDQADSSLESPHLPFARNTVHFFESPSRGGTANTGFLQLPKAQVHVAAERLRMLRNWLAELSVQSYDDPHQPYSEKCIFQYTLNLIPILNEQAVAELETRPGPRSEPEAAPPAETTL
jgi:uncharacterized protein (TIGR02147 family)